MIRPIYDWTLWLAGHRRASWALAAISFIESSIFPIPPDLLLIPMVLADRTRAGWLAGLCTVTSVVGGLAGYYIGWALFEVAAKPLRSRRQAASRSLRLRRRVRRVQGALHRLWRLGGLRCRRDALSLQGHHHHQRRRGAVVADLRHRLDPGARLALLPRRRPAVSVRRSATSSEAPGSVLWFFCEKDQNRPLVVSDYWRKIQAELFPSLQEQLGPLGERASSLRWRAPNASWCMAGPAGRVSKTIFNIDDLIERLRLDDLEAPTFSRAFAEFGPRAWGPGCWRRWSWRTTATMSATSPATVPPLRRASAPPAGPGHQLSPSASAAGRARARNGRRRRPSAACASPARAWRR